MVIEGFLNNSSKYNKVLGAIFLDWSYIKFKVLGFELAILICIKDLWKDLTKSFCFAQLMHWPSLWKKPKVRYHLHY